MAPARPRYDKMFQNIIVTLIICLTIVAVGGIAYVREDILARRAAYQHCLELQYSPRQCYDAVFNAPKPWESQ